MCAVVLCVVVVSCRVVSSRTYTTIGTLLVVPAPGLPRVLQSSYKSRGIYSKIHNHFISCKKNNNE